MGLMKLSGDLYNYEEDAKIAAQGVQSMDANQIAPNNLADKQPQQVDTQVQPVQAPLKQPAPNVPSAPVAAPEQEIYSPTPKSLPPLPPNTRYASYEGSKMSRLKDLLNKIAMTQEDIDLGYSDIPQEGLSEEDLFPEVTGNSQVQNYTVPSDYSNYMSAKAPAAQESYNMEEYADIPADAQYLGGFTTEADVDPGVYQMSPESMGYSPYSEGEYANIGQETNDFAGREQALYDSVRASEAMGYDPYQAYSNYEQMYASPTSGGEGYQDIQTQAAEPQVDQAQQAYQQSYDEVYNYLVQMGYSPEEAAASVPALLQQVNVAAPPGQKQASFTHYQEQPRVMTKTASIKFNSKANELKASYVEAGYSPYQAQQMSLEVVIPEAEKYASLAGRVIGGVAGGIGGAMLGDSRYDTEEGDDKGKILGAVLGAGLGGAFGGRVPSYFGRNVVKSDLVSKLQNMNNPLQKQKDLLTALRSSDAATSAKALRGARMEAGLGALGTDLRTTAGTATALAVPTFFADKAMRGEGKNNLIDASFDTADEVGEKVVEKAKETGNYLGGGVDKTLEVIKNNPKLMMALAGSAMAVPYAANKIREYKNPPKKGGRTKKAHIENALNKQASWKAHVGRTLGGALLGAGTQSAMDYSIMPEYVKEDDELYSQGLRAAALRGALGGALLGGLGGAGGGAIAGHLGKSVPAGANIGAGSALALGLSASAIPALMHNRNFEGEHSRGKRTFWDDFFGRNVREGLMEKGNIETERMNKQKEQYDKDEEKLKKQREKEKRQYLSPEQVRDRKEYDKYKADLKAKADKLKEEEEAYAQRRADQTWYENLGEDIKDDPVRAALIAGGTGAGLYGLYNLATSGPAESTNERLMRMYQQQQLRNKHRR